MEFVVFARYRARDGAAELVANALGRLDLIPL